MSKKIFRSDAIMKRRANGRGTVVKLSGNRLNPYVARILIGYNYLGQPILHQIGAYKTQLDGWIALEEFHKSPRPVYISRNTFNKIETFPFAPYNLVPTDNANTRKAFEMLKKNITFKEVFEMLKEEKFPTPEEAAEEKLHHAKAYGRFSVGHSNNLRYAYHKCDTLSDRIYADLRTKDFQKLIDELIRSGLNDGSIRMLLSLFNNMDKIALKNEIITTGYAKFINFTATVKKSKKAPFSRKEIQALKDAPEHWVKDVLLICLYTGCRISEVLSIYVKNVFLDKDYFVGGIKTNAGIDREIPIHSEVKYIFEKYYNTKNEFLFMRKGKKISLTIYEYQFSDFKESNPEIGKHTTHECRHTFRTELERLNVKQVIINAILGHSNGNVGLDTYTHITLEEKIEAVNRIEY